MKLYVKDIRELGKKYEVFQKAAGSLKNEPDDKELRPGDIMICPDNIAGRMYSKEIVRDAIRKEGKDGTDEEIEKVISSNDMPSVIFSKGNENKIFWDIRNVCRETLRKKAVGENGMHYYELTMWCSDSQYFKSESANPDIDKVVAWFIKDADDPYDEDDYKDLRELTPEEIYRRLEWEYEEELRRAEANGNWTEVLVEISKEEVER